jgi:predicted NACHT family NTPase
MIQTKKIFLACSEELLEERRELEIQISRKNKDWVPKGVHLQLESWEDFLDVMSRDGLQQEYKRTIRECDLFVMLFWTKVGRYTQEEFEAAFGHFRATNRPLILTYFKTEPSGIGSENEADLLSLWAFQKKLHALDHYQTRYPNTGELKAHFLQQLDKLAAKQVFPIDAPALTVPPRRSVSAITDQQLGCYLEWLQRRTRHIELRGLLSQGLVELPLEKAYVPLRARSMPRLGEVPANLQARGAGGEQDITLDEVLSLGQHLVIVGGPGSGKTTVLLHMAWALASSLLAGVPERARLRLGLQVEASELPLPILVPLASFARYRRHLPPSTPPRDRTLTHFISHDLIGREAVDLPSDFFATLLKERRPLLLLLDGLDEVASDAERAAVRQSVEDLVNLHPEVRAVITCRTVAYRSGRTALAAGFREIVVQALDPQQHVAPMVEQAYSCIYPQDVQLSRIDDLLRGIERLEQERRARLGPQAEPLVASPLMVRLLMIVHVNEHQLPNERAELFDKAIEALLRADYGREEGTRNELAAGWEAARDLATQLAFHMHSRGSDGGREIEEASIRQLLRSQDKAEVADFILLARERGSLLEERNGVCRFLHLAFQEFLVARHLKEVIGNEGRAALLAFLEERLEDPWWREPILLLAGYQASRQSQRANSLPRWRRLDRLLTHVSQRQSLPPLQRSSGVAAAPRFACTVRSAS